MNTPTTNGINLMTKIVDLAKTNPFTAVVLTLIFVGTFSGGISYATGFLGQTSAVTKELALLKAKDVYLESEIKAERIARIEEQVRLKEDGKLLTESDIIVKMRDELDKFEQRLIDRGIIK